MDPLTLGLFVLGLVFLIVGAELLVRGASDVAAAFGVSQLVIGLTVVSMGTSAPEMAVSVNAAFNGNADLALGNVVGSNIFNVLFILGLSAMIVPLTVDRKLVWVDVPLMIAVSALMWWMCSDGNVDRRDGLILVGGIVLYTLFTVIMGRRRPADVRPADENVRTPLVKNKPIIVSLVMIGIGLGLLVLGSNWLVDGAVQLAKAMGLSELVIGLTIIAAGTSLPEVATSIMAALRGKRDIAVGNAIGSNLFNIMGILGVTAALAPAGVSVPDSALALDLPFMVAVAVACLPIFFVGHSISRSEGLLFFLYYAAYTAYLILAANKYENLGTFSTAFFVFISPLVAITLLVRFVRALRVSRGEPAVKKVTGPPVS